MYDFIEELRIMYGFIEEKIGDNAYVVKSNSGEAWYYDTDYTKRHRIDGPAITMIEFSLPNKEMKINYEWWYFGEKIPCSSQEEFEKLLKMKAFW